MKDLNLSAFIVVLVMLSSMATALASGETKIISLKEIMYPGASINRYLSADQLILSEKARKACPNGIARISKIQASVEGDFIVNDLNSEAHSYPNVTTRAVIECK